MERMSVRFGMDRVFTRCSRFGVRKVDDEVNTKPQARHLAGGFEKSGFVAIGDVGADVPARDDLDDILKQLRLSRIDVLRPLGDVVSAPPDGLHREALAEGGVATG